MADKKISGIITDLQTGTIFIHWLNHQERYDYV